MAITKNVELNNFLKSNKLEKHFANVEIKPY